LVKPISPSKLAEPRLQIPLISLMKPCPEAHPLLIGSSACQMSTGHLTPQRSLALLAQALLGDSTWTKRSMGLPLRNSLRSSLISVVDAFSSLFLGYCYRHAFSWGTVLIRSVISFMSSVPIDTHLFYGQLEQPVLVARCF
jgi:hypothetical protein